MIREAVLDELQNTCLVHQAHLLFLDPLNALERRLRVYEDLLLAVPLPIASSVHQDLLLIINDTMDCK